MSRRRRRITPRGVALELRVANAAIRRRDWRIAKLAVEIHLAPRMHGPIRQQHRSLSLLLDALVLRDEEAA